MPDASGLLRGKRGLIMGLANNRSLAWGIAKACRAHGADLAFSYQGDALKKRVEPLVAEIGGLLLGHCDVSDPVSIEDGIDEIVAALEDGRVDPNDPTTVTLEWYKKMIQWEKTLNEVRLNGRIL